MKKFLKKFLTYLVMTMMVTPTWLVTGMIGAEKARAAEGNPRVLSYSLNGKASDVYYASKAGVLPVDISVTADRAVVFDSLDIVDKNGVPVRHYYSEAYNATISREWNGKTTGGASGVYVEDGVYSVNVKMTDQSDPPLNNGDGEVLESKIIIDNTKPVVNSFMDRSLTLNEAAYGSTLELPVVYSEDMDVNSKPVLKFMSNESDFNQILKCDESMWITPRIYNFMCSVGDNFTKNIPATSANVSGATDLAGNQQLGVMSTGTLSVSTPELEAKIVSPVKSSAVNGNQKIVISSNKTIETDCSVRLSLNSGDWSPCIGGEVETTLLDIAGFVDLPQGPFTLWAEVVDETGSTLLLSVELIKDTVVPTGTITYSTTNPTNKSVVATLVTDEEVTVLNNDSMEYTFTGNGAFTFLFRDAAGNEGSATATVENIVDGEIISSPQIDTTVSGKSINVKWSPVVKAVSYIVYSSPKSAGLISETHKGVFTNVGNVTEYVLNVAEYGEYYVTVTAVDQYGNESSFLSEFTGQKLVTVSAPAPVVDPVPAPAPIVIEPESDTVSNNNVSIAAPKANAEDKEEVAATTKDDEGEIKGDDSVAEEDSKVNWTPWIVLFVLIILAGAATGGYFYWFNGEDEVSAVVREKKVVKQETTPVKATSKKVNNKKSKRW